MTWQTRIVGHGEEAPDQLLANPRNWRIHPKAQQDALAAVLDEVGWVQDIIVNRQSGYVVDGHARVALAISRNEAMVPVVYVDLEPAEEAKVLATIDPIAAMATADPEQLDALLREVGTNSDALKAMLADLARTAGNGGPKDGLTDPDDVPEVTEPITRPGDLWLLGNHRLLCGDSTNAADVARVMDGAQAVCLWTDPPYGVSIVGGNRQLTTSERIAARPDSSTIAGDTPDELPELLRGVFANAAAALEPGSPWYCARPAGAHSFLFADAIRNVGWKLHQELQWVKGTMVLGHSDYHLKHETIMYGWVPGPGRSGRGKQEGSRWYGDNSQTSVMEIPLGESPDHPSMKPVALVVAHLGNSSPPSGIVYEPFCGSGTTIIACEQLGRRCHALEIDPKYVDVAVRRWEQFTGRTAERG